MRRIAPFPWLPPCLLVLLAACAADPSFRAAADMEMARRPEFYSNGEARAWQVSKDGTVRGLLWGTMHIPYGTDTMMPAPIRTRFYSAADLTVESVLDRAPAALQAIRTRSRQANAAYDPAAVQRLDEPTRDALASVPGADDRLSLRGLATRVAAAATREAYDPAALPDIGFVDLNLIGFARAQDRPVRGLEAPEAVDATLADPNGPEAAGLLRRWLRQREAYRAFNRWLAATYGRGEVSAVSAALAAWDADADDLRRSDKNRAALFTRRNAAWLPRLDRLFARPGDHFVAVGAGHLTGSDGLVALLRGRGYQVTPCPGDVCP